MNPMTITSDPVPFIVNDIEAETGLLQSSLASMIDVEPSGYYIVPNSYWDDVVDFMTSHGCGYSELDETSTTAGTPGYDTPFAFGKLKKNRVETMGYKLVPKTNKYFKRMEGVAPKASSYRRVMNEMYLNESIGYRDYKSDPSASPQQKINRSIKEVNNMLSEIEQVITKNLRLKTELGVDSGQYWKSTATRFAKINERLTRISNRIKELSQ